MKLNVRCCCQPTKILGTFEIPVHPWQQSFMLFTAEFVRDPISVFAAPSNVCPTAPSLVKRVEHVIQIKTFGYVERAVYSDDRPIEFWRQFPQFKEGAYSQDGIAPQGRL